MCDLNSATAVGSSVAVVVVVEGAVGVVANCAAASKLSHEIYFANTKFINFTAAALLSADVGCAALLYSVGRLLVVVVAEVGFGCGYSFSSHRKSEQ